MEKTYSFELHEEIKIPALKMEWPKTGQVLTMPEFVETGNVKLSFNELEELQDPFLTHPFFRGETGTLRTVVVTMSATFIVVIVFLVLVRIYGFQVLCQKLASCLCLVCNKRFNTVIEPTLTPDVSTTGPGAAPTSASMADSGLISFKNSFLPKVPTVTPPTAPFLTSPPPATPTAPASAYPQLQDEGTHL
jgi:hypothetical protein